MSPRTPLTTRPVELADEERWRELFRGYRDFYRLADSEDVVSTVWGWLMNESHESHGLVAEHDGAIIGIAHFRRFARPSTGSTGLWLDDLFTDPDARGKGAGRALITALTDLAAAEGLSVVRWITAENNERAQELYNQVASRTMWVTYDAAPTEAESH